MNTSEKDQLKKDLLDRIRSRFLDEETEDRKRAMDIITSVLFQDERAFQLENREAEALSEEIYLMTKGKLGILDPLIDDPDINEIMVNGPEKIFYEKGSKLIRYDMSFNNSEELEEVMRSIAGQVHREINELNPIVDARLPSGARVNGVYKNVAIGGPVLTIRKFSDSYITMDDLISNETQDSSDHW